MVVRLNAWYLPDVTSFFASIVSPGAAWAATIFFFMYRQELEAQGVQLTELLLMQAFYVVHKLMVGIKYGFQNSKEYEWYLTEPDFKRASRYNSTSSSYRVGFAPVARPSRKSSDSPKRGST